MSQTLQAFIVPAFIIWSIACILLGCAFWSVRK